MSRRKSEVPKEGKTIYPTIKTYEDYQKYCEDNGYVLSRRLDMLMEKEMRKCR